MTIMACVLDQAPFEVYFLRGLLWCEPCGELLVPATTADGGRFYGCLGEACPRPLIEAGPIEATIWHRYTALNEAAAQKVGRDQRHAVLIDLLRRVTIGRTVVDLGFDWRD